jgi:alpha-tubulin suppressor-like RCC1 family protein
VFGESNDPSLPGIREKGFFELDEEIIDIQIKGMDEGSSDVEGEEPSGSMLILLTKNGVVYIQGFWGNDELLINTNRNITKLRFPLNKNELVTKIASGSFHCLALTNLGRVFGWGFNHFHQIPNSNERELDTPKLINFTNFDHIVDIACNAYSSFFLTKHGDIYGAGSFNGKKTILRKFKTEKSSKEEFTRIHTGNSESMVIATTKQNTLYVFSDDIDLIGFALNGKPKPYYFYKLKTLPINSDDFVSQIALGYKHVLIKTNSNPLFSWGDNEWSQTGHPKEYDYYSGEEIINVPLELDLKNLEKLNINLYAGYYHNFIQINDSVFGFGENSHYCENNPFNKKMGELMFENNNEDDNFISVPTFIKNIND